MKNSTSMPSYQLYTQDLTNGRKISLAKSEYNEKKCVGAKEIRVPSRSGSQIFKKICISKAKKTKENYKNILNYLSIEVITECVHF